MLHCSSTEACNEHEDNLSHRQSELVAGGVEAEEEEAGEVVKRDATATSAKPVRSLSPWPPLGNNKDSRGNDGVKVEEGELLPSDTCERGAGEDKVQASQETEKEENEGQVAAQRSSATSTSLSSPIAVPPLAAVCSSGQDGQNNNNCSEDFGSTWQPETGGNNRSLIRVADTVNSDFRSVLLSCTSAAVAATACCTSSLLLLGATCEHRNEDNGKLLISASDTSSGLQHSFTSSDVCSVLPSSPTVFDSVTAKTGGDHQGKGAKVISNDLSQSAVSPPPVITSSRSVDEKSGVSHCQQLQSPSSSVSRTNANDDSSTFSSKFNDQTGDDDACGHRPQEVVSISAASSSSSPVHSHASSLLLLSNSASRTPSSAPTLPPTPSSIISTVVPSTVEASSHSSALPFSADSSCVSSFSPSTNLIQPQSTAISSPPSSPSSPTVFGQIKKLKHLPRLRSSIVEFERQSSLTADLNCGNSSPVIVDGSPSSAVSSSSLSADTNASSSERFIVQLKSVLCTECLLRETRSLLPYSL